MEFSIATEPRAKNLIVKLSGRIGGKTSLDMYSEVKVLMDQYKKLNVVLDFTGVDFLDSSGLGALVAVNSSLIRQNRELALASVPDNILSLLKITSLQKILRIIESSDNVE